MNEHLRAYVVVVVGVRLCVYAALLNFFRLIHSLGRARSRTLACECVWVSVLTMAIMNTVDFDAADSLKK